MFRRREQRQEQVDNNDDEQRRQRERERQQQRQRGEEQRVREQRRRRPIPKTLHEAAHRGDLLWCQSFLKQCKRAKGKKGVAKAVNRFHGLYSFTPLQMAADSGNGGVVSLLIDCGATVEARNSLLGFCALDYACAKGNLWCVQLLLDAGASADEVSRGGCTPLMLASREGRVETMRELLEQWAVDVEAADAKGARALHHAAAAGHVDAIQLLVGEPFDCDIDARTERKFTPLMMAAMRGHIDVVECLLDYGASQTARSASNRTAAMMALEHTAVQEIFAAFPPVLTLRALCLIVVRRHQLRAKSSLPPLVFRWPSIPRLVLPDGTTAEEAEEALATPRLAGMPPLAERIRMHRMNNERLSLSQ
jgi:Ankyrin repeats (3 copies)/Ankyrin repeat